MERVRGRGVSYEVDGEFCYSSSMGREGGGRKVTLLLKRGSALRTEWAGMLGTSKDARCDREDTAGGGFKSAEEKVC